MTTLRCIAVLFFVMWQPVYGQAVTTQRGGAIILLVNPQAVLDGSVAGQRLVSENRRLREDLATEIDAISEAYEEEERQLTELRATLPPAEFNVLASEFDARVRADRIAQDRRGQELAAQTEARERGFNESLVPIYAQIMQEVGAAAILDLRSVILANSRLDVTTEVIRRLDTEETNVSPDGAPEN